MDKFMVKIAKTPMPTKGQLGLCEDEKDVDQKVYYFMIGSLLYLCASRPDISLSVGLCDCYQAAPKESHLMVVKQILKYLAHTPCLGLRYPKVPLFLLLATWIPIGSKISLTGSLLWALVNFLEDLW
jgi:hypothetical protein